MATATISGKFTWEWREGSGALCEACNQEAFLRELEFVMEINGRRNHTDFILCQSCGEVLKSLEHE